MTTILAIGSCQSSTVEDGFNSLQANLWIRDLKEFAQCIRSLRNHQIDIVKSFESQVLILLGCTITSRLLTICCLSLPRIFFIPLIDCGTIGRRNIGSIFGIVMESLNIPLIELVWITRTIRNHWQHIEIFKRFLASEFFLWISHALVSFSVSDSLRSLGQPLVLVVDDSADRLGDPNAQVWWSSPANEHRYIQNDPHNRERSCRH